MYTKIAFASLVASAAAEANIMGAPLVQRNLQPRQSVSVDLPASCTDALLTLVGSLPTPPPEIISDIATETQSDFCDFTPPSSLSSEYSSYSSEIVSWYSAHSSEIDSAVSECPALLSYASSLPVCSTDAAGLIGGSGGSAASNTASTTGTSGGSGSGGSSTSGGGGGSGATSSGATGAGATSATGTGAAPRETGMGFAALAAAGLAMAL